MGVRICQCGCGLPIDGKGLKYRVACSHDVEREKHNKRRGTRYGRSTGAWSRDSSWLKQYLKEDSVVMRLHGMASRPFFDQMFTVTRQRKRKPQP